MTEQEIRDGVAARKWFHCIHLPYGIITPGSRERDAWSMYKLPDRLDGKRVLDIGAWDGGFSFESERRGAKSVTALDLWGEPDGVGSRGWGKDNFDFAHLAIGSKVNPVRGSVLDLPMGLGEFDLILFLQVLYHLQDPLLAIRKVYSALAKGGSCFLETWVDAEWVEQPAMIFYPGEELAGDSSNWWGPNIKCVQSMAATAGFTSADLVWWRRDPNLNGRGKRACFHLR